MLKWQIVEIFSCCFICVLCSYGLAFYDKHLQGEKDQKMQPLG
jgi:hypothetical protein